MDYWYLVYALIFFALILIVPHFVKRWYYKKLMQDIEEKNFTKFEKNIDSFPAKMCFSAFERESMRLTMYKMMGKTSKADEQIQFMEHMRLSKKQRAQLGEIGFYTYLEQGKVKKARHMIDLVKDYGTPAQAENLEIQYSILLKKESKYIQNLIERHKKLENAQGEIPDSLSMNAGVFEYLIGLQYSYEKDRANMKKWLNMALPRLKGTYYEEDIRNLLRQG